MKHKSVIVSLLFVMSIILISCTEKTFELKPRIFNTKYNCDSIFTGSLGYLFEDETSAYFELKKAPFNFKLYLDTGIVVVNDLDYHHFIAGINPDTVGLIRFTINSYFYRAGQNQNDALLFNFEAQPNDCWIINELGYFRNYKVCLDSIKFIPDTNDTIYYFDFDQIGHKMSHGYYFNYFEVSKINGILSFSFNKGVKCVCTTYEFYPQDE